jgi:hypothetical protein
MDAIGPAVNAPITASQIIVTMPSRPEADDDLSAVKLDAGTLYQRAGGRGFLVSSSKSIDRAEQGSIRKPE